MKKYEEIKFKDLDWYYLGEKDEIVSLLLKNVLDEERIKKYADDEFMIDGSDVRHQDTIRPYDWDKSYIKNVILPAFKKDLGLDCEIDLLSKEEVENLPLEIRKCDDCYWTKTPQSVITYNAFFVNLSGNASSNFVDNNYGVRPVIYIKSTQFFDEIVGQNSYRQKIEKLEKCADSEELIEKINEIIDILKEMNKEENLCLKEEEKE